MGRRRRRRKNKHRNKERRMKQPVGFRKNKAPTIVVLLCTGCLLRHIADNNVTCSHYKG